jgi:lipoprotein signal peptidase
MTGARKIAFSLIFSLGLISLDQFSKYTIRQSGGFYLCNPGIAWGIKLPDFIFWLLWILILSFVIYFIWKNYQKTEASILSFFALFLILAGACGNFLDRIFFGCVIDFIDLKVWPIFNLADSFITIGAIMIVIKHTTHNIKQKHS